jgi:hypothetical protein
MFPARHVAERAGDRPPLGATRCTPRVRDTGVGVVRGERERSVEPAFTTKAPARGTGPGSGIGRDGVRRGRDWRPRSSVVDARRERAA